MFLRRKKNNRSGVLSPDGKEGPMTQTVMTMKILIPFQVFEERTDVTNIVAETSAGSFGILPRRLDCVASIVPGILIYETVGGQEKYAALDEGVLVKTGYEVFLSVRRANKGDNLEALQRSVEEEFLDMDESEKSVRRVLARLETGIIRKFVTLGNE